MGIEGIVARDTKLVVIKGHDCITHLLGSKERYREYFDANPGTYWYSPGWIELTNQPGKERYESTLKSYIEKYGEDNAEYLMEMEQAWYKNYSNAAYIDLGFDDSTKNKEYTKECADWLGWKYDELSGDPSLIINFLEGNWNPEDFLVVEPGEMIVPSNDENVIRTIKAAEKEGGE